MPPGGARGQSTVPIQCCSQTPEELAAGLTPNTAYPLQNVLRYGADPTGKVDCTESLKHAFALGNEITVPAGDYKIAGTVAKVLTKSFSIRGAGQGSTRILQHADADAFALVSTGPSGVQITVEGLSIIPATSMSNGAALNFRDDRALPTVTVRDVFIGTSGGGEFKYGIRMLNCTEAQFERVTIYGLGSDRLVAWDLRSTAPSTVPKFFGCSVYNALTAVNIENSVKPGIEGVQLYGCDFVAVSTGVRYRNSVADFAYFPPQITWIGGHINASYRNFDIEQATQVIILGALLYNSASGGQFIRLATCSDLNIQSNEFVQVGGSSDGIAFGAGGLVNGGIIANNHFSLGEASSAINLNAANIQNLDISNNVRRGGAATIKITGALKSTVRMTNNFPLDAEDASQLSSVAGTSLSLIGLRANFILVSAPQTAVVISKLVSRRIGETVTLKCDSPLLTLQHNGSSPDGFVLRGATNFTFGSGSLITFYNGNGGYWTEISRSV